MPPTINEIRGIIISPNFKEAYSQYFVEYVKPKIAKAYSEIFKICSQVRVSQEDYSKKVSNYFFKLLHFYIRNAMQRFSWENLGRTAIDYATTEILVTYLLR